MQRTLDLGGTMAVLGFFSLTLASEERGLVSKEFAKRFRQEAYGFFMGSCAFLISMLPIFYTTDFGPLGPIRFYIWVVPLFLVWLRRA